METFHSPTEDAKAELAALRRQYTELYTVGISVLNMSGAIKRGELKPEEYDFAILYSRQAKALGISN